MKVTKWEDLDSDMQDLMLKRQEEQGNRRSPLVFIKRLSSNREDGGFNWINTPEKDSR